MTAGNMAEEVCRDFENGRCTRGNRCKFFHPKLPICKDFQNKGCDRVKCKFLHILREEEQNYETSGILPDHIAEEFRNKRTNNTSMESQHRYGGMYGKRRREENYMMPEMPTISPGLIEENDFLKRKISDLQHQILDLRQMNDTLYDQNTRYRNQLRSSSSAQVIDPYSKPSVGLAAVGLDVPSRSYYDFN